MLCSATYVHRVHQQGGAGGGVVHCPSRRGTQIFKKGGRKINLGIKTSLPAFFLLFFEIRRGIGQRKKEEEKSES